MRDSKSRKKKERTERLLLKLRLEKQANTLKKGPQE
jgi:hypothetical protein